MILLTFMHDIDKLVGVLCFYPSMKPGMIVFQRDYCKVAYESYLLQDVSFCPP